MKLAAHRSQAREMCCNLVPVRSALSGPGTLLSHILAEVRGNPGRKLILAWVLKLSPRQSNQLLFRMYRGQLMAALPIKPLSSTLHSSQANVRRGRDQCYKCNQGLQARAKDSHQWCWSCTAPSIYILHGAMAYYWSCSARAQPKTILIGSWLQVLWNRNNIKVTMCALD